MSLDQVRTRQEAFDLLDGYAEERKEELGEKKTRRPLVKSYMLETVPRSHQQPGITDLFQRSGIRLSSLDDTLYAVYDPRVQRTVGLLEMLMERHPVIYTCEKSAEMDKWVRNLVFSSAELDNLWLSGRAFEQMLDAILHMCPTHRYGRLVFQHDSLFADDHMAAEYIEADDDLEADTPSGIEMSDVDLGVDGGDDDDYIPERRTSKFTIIDRLSVLKDKLPLMRDLYSPLHSIAQLRFPARGPGGHDFYFNGKATNRSDSFSDHRQHLQFVLKVYRRATEETESVAWQSAENVRISTGSHETLLVGAPVTLRFSEALAQGTFEKFIESTFRRATNRFRLWGNPITLGPRKVHVYGVDRHLWQPLFLEITDQHITVILPRGTCGNVIHRLVTNVQQYLDPNVAVWVGDQPYDEIIRVEPEARRGDGDQGC